MDKFAIWAQLEAKPGKEAEVEAFLAQERTVTMCTMHPSGSIHAVAMWYAFLDGAIAVETKAKDLEDGRWLIASGILSERYSRASKSADSAFSRSANDSFWRAAHSRTSTCWQASTAARSSAGRLAVKSASRGSP